MLKRFTSAGRRGRNRHARINRYQASVESLETRTLLASNVWSLLASSINTNSSDTGGADTTGTDAGGSDTNDTNSGGSDTGSSDAGGTDAGAPTADSSILDATQPIRFDFGTANSALASGMFRVTPNDTLTDNSLFGLLPTGVDARSRSGWWSDHSRDFVSGNRVTFAARLHAGGTYSIRYAFGDPLSSRSQTVSVEGNELETVTLRRRQYHAESQEVVVSDDGLLELTVASRSSRPALLNSLVIKLVEMPPEDPDTGGTNTDRSNPGGTDTGGTDTGGTDTGGTDTGGTDTGGTDTGGTDTGGTDTGGTDTGGTDTGGTDTGGTDTGGTDTGGTDTGGTDTGGTDTGGTDTGGTDTGSLPVLDIDPIQFDFGTTNSALASGMIRVTPDDTLADDNLYGLVRTGSSISAASREGWWADHSRDFVSADRFVFAVRLHPGATYSVRYAFGDSHAGRTQTVGAEGTTLETVNVRRRRYYVGTREVIVSDDGLLELSLESRSNQLALLNSVVIRLVAMPPDNSDPTTGGGSDSGSGGADPDGTDTGGSSDHSDDCGPDSDSAAPAWLATFPASEAPVFSPEQYAITCSQAFVPGTTWSGLNEQQVFAQRISVDSPDQQPAYEFRVGKGSQIYSLRLPNGSGQWVDAVATQRPWDGVEWVDEVVQTVIVDTELNDRSSESTKNQIHQSGTYRNINGVPTFYSPVLDEAWVPDQRSFSTISWPQQAHIPSNFKSHFLHMQQIRDLGSGVLEVTYVYHNFSQEGEKATFLAAPWLPVRDSTFPYQFRSRPDGTIQRDQRSWCVGSNCGPTGVAINETDGYFVFSSGLNGDDPAMAIVFGVDENTEGQTSKTNYRWGTVSSSQRDLTATSVQKRVRIEPGEVFYHRFYLVVNTLQGTRDIARQLRSHVDQGFLTPDPNAATDVCFAMEGGQLVPTACSSDAVFVSTSSTPRTDWQPLLTMVDSSSGSRAVTNDPYLFMRRPYLREYEVDGILGWVSPDTISQLAANQDPDVTNLFSLAEP